jgi:hypothetical protein
MLDYRDSVFEPLKDTITRQTNGIPKSQAGMKKRFDMLKEIPRLYQ